MPKGWFFEIHVDTAEEEAANLMEHSASVLDISSDDDAATRRQNELREKGKENIPPPEHFANLPANAVVEASGASAAVPSKSARRSRKNISPDAMLEDRKPLEDLPASDFYPEGLDASSKVIVRGDIASPQKPSGLSKQFDFSAPAVPSPKVKLEAAKVEKDMPKSTEVQVDIQSKEIFVLEDES